MLGYQTGTELFREFIRVAEIHERHKAGAQRIGFDFNVIQVPSL